MVKSEITDYYANRGGNNHGLPVTVMHLNIGWWLDDETTDDFIAEHDIQIVADDFGYEAFTPLGGTGTPHFVVINGVADSASHEQWEVVAIDDNGWPLVGSTAGRVATLRGYIDSVQAPPEPPVLGPARIVDGNIQFTVTSEAGKTICVESTTDFNTWNLEVNVVNTTGTYNFRAATPATGLLRVYRAQLK